MKVAVLGAAGGIGPALALLLKTQLPSGSELSLYDIAPVTARKRALVLSLTRLTPQLRLLLKC